MPFGNVCCAFGPAYANERIARIYVINLDRQPDRWDEIRRELDQVLDCSGKALTERAVRVPAADARSFARLPEADDDVGPIYTLGDQLFVEPQLRVLSDRFELDRPIRISWPEVAVARSHVGVWRRIAAGDDAYALVLEDDVWFHWGFDRYVDRAWRERALVLAAACAANPERFVRRPPTLAPLPTAVWINPPKRLESEAVAQ